MATFARSFTGVSSCKVTCSIGSVGAFGPSTCAAVFNMTTGGLFQPIVGAGSADTWSFGTSNTDKLNLWNGTADTPGLTTVSTGVWYCAAVTKATGSVVPRFHLFRYSTGVWIHENAGSSAANSGAPATSVALGSSVAAALGFPGVIQIAGYWTRELSDVELEALANNSLAWQAATPSDGWLLTQQVTTANVSDFTGNGANQTSTTGTSVVTGNPNFDSAQSRTFTPVPLMR